MSEGTLIRGVVLAHGGMAGGMVDAVARIAGAADDALVAVSNDGKSQETLRSELEEILSRGPTIIFTDLPSGSCALTARLCCREDPGAAVVFGVNLPMLLDFVFHRSLPMAELVPRLLEKGRGSLVSSLDHTTDAHRPVSG